MAVYSFLSPQFIWLITSFFPVGIEPLWSTRQQQSVDLSATGADLVLLGHQEGEENEWTAGQRRETRDKLDHSTVEVYRDKHSSEWTKRKRNKQRIFGVTVKKT